MTFHLDIWFAGSKSNSDARSNSEVKVIDHSLGSQEAKGAKVVGATSSEDSSSIYICMMANGRRTSYTVTIIVVVNKT